MPKTLIVGARWNGLGEAVLNRGGSDVYPQSTFWIKNKKNVYNCIPQFYYI